MGTLPILPTAGVGVSDDIAMVCDDVSCANILNYFSEMDVFLTRYTAFLTENGIKR